MSTPNHIPGMRLKGIARKRNLTQLNLKRERKWVESRARRKKQERQNKKKEQL